MGLFDIFKKRKSVSENTVTPINPNNERSIKQSEERHHEKIHEATQFEQMVITFEERKKTCIPSKRGLYVAEILLLEYCNYGNYPVPSNEYPRFWWFEYGIKDINSILKSLEDRGFIMMGSVFDNVSCLKVGELKQLLDQFNIPANGKKNELVERVKANIPESAVRNSGVYARYQLTMLGKEELLDNGYVPYMHKHPRKTTSDDTFGSVFNVWSINRMLANRPNDNWKDVVDEVEKNIEQQIIERNRERMGKLKSIDPALYETLKIQDAQLEEIQEAESRYKADGDIGALIEFWEKLWKKGGLKFNGSYWHFRLAELYIAEKRYNDVITFCEMLKQNKPDYADRANNYIQRMKSK